MPTAKAYRGSLHSADAASVEVEAVEKTDVAVHLQWLCHWRWRGRSGPRGCQYGGGGRSDWLAIVHIFLCSPDKRRASFFSPSHIAPRGLATGAATFAGGSDGAMAANSGGAVVAGRWLWAMEWWRWAHAVPAGCWSGHSEGAAVHCWPACASVPPPRRAPPPLQPPAHTRTFFPCRRPAGIDRAAPAPSCVVDDGGAAACGGGDFGCSTGGTRAGLPPAAPRRPSRPGRGDGGSARVATEVVAPGGDGSNGSEAAAGGDFVAAASAGTAEEATARLLPSAPGPPTPPAFGMVSCPPAPAPHPGPAPTPLPPTLRHPRGGGSAAGHRRCRR